MTQNARRRAGVLVRLVLFKPTDVIRCHPAISLSTGSVSRIRETVPACSVRLEKK